MRAVGAACPKCGVRFRGSRVTIATAPGTRTRGGGGLCQTCWRQSKRAGVKVPVFVEPVFDTRLAAVALECYMTERRARLARRAA